MALNTGGPRRQGAAHGVHHRLVVSEDVEYPSLEEETEVADGGVGTQQLSVKSRVLHLRRRQLPGEEGEGAPAAVLELLQDAADV